MDDDFDLFWQAYPRKQAKGDARKAWVQTARIRPAIDEVLKAIDNACRSDQWMRDSGTFIPYPATWLRSERWSDEYTISIKPRLPLASEVLKDSPSPPSDEQKAKVAEMLRSTGIRRVA